MSGALRIGAFQCLGDVVRYAIVKAGAKPTVLELHRVEAQYAEPEEREEALIAAIKAMMHDVKQKPAANVLCASSCNAVARAMTLPFRGKRRIAAAVRFELEPYLAFPIEDLMVNHMILRERDGQTDVLALGVRRDSVQESMALLQSAGVGIDAVALDVLALTSLCLRGTKNPGLRGVLHITESATLFAAVSNKTVEYIRYLPFSATQFNEQSPMVIRETKNSLRAFLSARHGEATLSSLVVCGGALTDEERPAFEEQMQVPVEYIDPLDRIILSKHIEADDAYAMLPLIATAASGAGGPNALNFLKNEPAGKTSQGLRSHLMFSVVLIAVFALLGIAYAFIDYHRSKTELDEIGNAIYDVFEQAVPDAPSRDELADDIARGGQDTFASLEDYMDALAKSDDASSLEVYAKPKLLDMLLEIAEKMPDDKAHITSIRLDRGTSSKSTLRIEGEVKSLETFDAVFAELKKSDLFQVTEEPTRTFAEGKATFVITLNF